MDNKEYGHAILRNMRTCRRLEDTQWVGATWKEVSTWKEASKRSMALAVVWLSSILLITYMHY